jgi:hypothetical protein
MIFRRVRRRFHGSGGGEGVTEKWNAREIKESRPSEKVFTQHAVIGA